ncbi:MAG: DinB family protein [Dehalococcoidia bacterium]
MDAELLGLWPQVAATRAGFLQALDVTETQARAHPAGDPTGWCILQVAQHVLGWTLNVEQVIEATASGRTLVKHPRGYLDAGLPNDLDEVRRALAAASMRFLSLPERLPEHPDLETTVPHEVYGPLNCRGWFARCAAHDGEHLAQVEALRSEALD